MRNELILVADSDAAVATCIAEVLTAEGYTVQCHPSDRLTIDAIKQVRPALVIMEQWRACPEVLQLIDQLQQCDVTHSIAVIVTTTDPLMLYELAMLLHERGCTMLLKPFDLDQLLDSVAGAERAGQQRAAAPKLEQRYA